MRRCEIVKEAIRVGIPINVTAGEIEKYWTIEDQEHAIAMTEMQIGLVNTAAETMKTLLKHNYPVDFITDEPIDVDVRIDPPDKYKIAVVVKLSPKITTMINNLRGKEYYIAPRKDVVSYLVGAADVLGVKLAAEKEHLGFLNEVV
jgi:hypothetical protein